MRLIKRLLIMLVLLLACSQVFAEMLQERRIYYLDATYSMVTNKLWELCKENLINAIKNIEDINTEIVVVVFADDICPTKNVWEKWEEKATSAGKNKLINEIKNLTKPVTSSMTNLYSPWVDFYSELRPGTVNYLFLMTDGGHESKYNGGIPLNAFLDEIDKWAEKTDSLTYGFYVELSEEVSKNEEYSRNKTREHIDRQKQRLWRVSTADVNINLVRLEQTATFNVRGDKHVDIPVYFSGKDKEVLKKLVFCFEGSDAFTVDSIAYMEDCIRVSIGKNVDIHTYPENSTIALSVLLNNADDKTFLLTNTVSINCLNKKEKTLYFSNPQITGTIEHYNAFLWKKAHTDTLRVDIGLEFNKDALADPQSFITFSVVDNNGYPLPSSSVYFAQNEVPFSENTITVYSSDERLSLIISFPEGTDKGVHQGYFKPTSYLLDRIGNIVLNEQSTDFPLTWRIQYKNCMNPLAKIVMRIGIIIALFFLFWFLVWKPLKFPKFRTFRKRILIKRDGVAVAQINVDFKKARRVVFANQKQHQSFANRLFTGRIKTVVNPVFEDPISFVPKQRGRMAMAIGKGYVTNPNPIPQNGVATITNTIKKIVITTQ